MKVTVLASGASVVSTAFHYDVMRLCSFIILLATSTAIRSANVEDLERNYDFNALLDDEGDYTLYWNYDPELKTITFAVRVRTTGWIGFGLSPNGQMPQSDVVIGWVDDSGRSFFHVSSVTTS